MSRLTLSSAPKTEYTAISNLFIDRYMPRANGTYVKVYLYLLRLLGCARTGSTLAAVADFLDETEKDIERALKYWETQRLMRIDRDGSGVVAGVVFLEPPALEADADEGFRRWPSDSPDFGAGPAAAGRPEDIRPGYRPSDSPDFGAGPAAAGRPEDIRPGYRPSDSPDFGAGPAAAGRPEDIRPGYRPSDSPDFGAGPAAAGRPEGEGPECRLSDEPGAEAGLSARGAGNGSSVRQTGSSDTGPAAVPEDSRERSCITAKRRLPEKPDYSEAQIEVLTSLDEVKKMLTQLQRVTARLLRGSDLNFVLYLYETVGFPADLIVYLYEYCASRNKTGISYIESVAIAWAENGIDTVEKAKAESAVYSSCYSTINRAFGLNRSPGGIELQYIHRWTGAYGFDASIIEEACNRTMLAVAKPDFKYAERILERWHTAGVHKKEDIAVLDAEFARQNTRREAERQENDRAGTAAAGNRFNAFPQRKYSASDYSEMEKQLLGSK